MNTSIILICPVIRSQAFKNKKLLFMNLVRYFEDAPFNRDNVNIAEQLLKAIPREIILSCVGVFRARKLWMCIIHCPKINYSYCLQDLLINIRYY